MGKKTKKGGEVSLKQAAQVIAANRNEGMKALADEEFYVRPTRPPYKPTSYEVLPALRDAFKKRTEQLGIRMNKAINEAIGDWLAKHK